METISRLILTFLLNALWQVPLVAAVAAMVCRLIRQGPASHRHAVWVAALAASLVLPMASMRSAAGNDSLRAAVPAPEAAIANAAASTAALPAAPAAAHRTATSAARTISYAPAVGAILFGAYLLFLLARCGALLVSWMRTERIRDDASFAAMPPLVEKVWLRCLATFELYDVELLRSSTVSGPVAAGAWRKSIILPETLLAETSEDVLTTAIGHEMAHLARRDFALKVACEIAWLPLSFHPAALVIRRGIEQTREIACDELVTRKLLDASVYARSIMTIARAMTALPRPGYTLGVFDGDILEQRIRRLVERRTFNVRRARMLLATGLGALALCVAIASGLAISARAQGGPAAGEMETAVDAYNHGNIHLAVQHFQNAVSLEPDNVRPKLFLANALMRSYNTENGSPDALAAARQQYLDALARDPQNKQALAGMANVALFARQFAESRDWVNKLLAQDPKDASAYYTAGFLDWSTIYPAYAKARLAAGMAPETQGPIPDAEARQSLRNQYGSQLEDGFRMLQTALELNPADSDTMAYINLLFRIKAGLADSNAESRDAVAQADEWVGRALEAKRLKAQNSGPARTALSVKGEAPGPGDGMAPPPPPPPPPPPNQPVSAAPMRPRNPYEVAGLFWQVSQGSTFATTLAASLKSQGFPVRMVAGPDGLVRVMVGPYNDQQALDQAQSRLVAAEVTVLRQW